MGQLSTAIKRAKHIRQRLLRAYGNDDRLCGFCGLASLMLAAEMGSIRSLRARVGHVWNVFDETVIDITAGQFDECPQRGVYVGSLYASYVHRQTMSGREAARYVDEMHAHLHDNVWPHAFKAVRQYEKVVAQLKRAGVRW